MGCASGKAVGKVGEVPQDGKTLLQSPNSLLKEQLANAQSSSEPAAAATASAERPEVTQQVSVQENDTVVQEEVSGPEAAKESSSESRTETAATEDRVTKISSSVMMVNYVPTDEEESMSTLPSGQRSSKRKATPWHKAGAAVVDFDCDDEEEDEEENEKEKEPMKRKAVRKATPWTKGTAVLDLEEEEDDDDLEKAPQEITEEGTAPAPPVSWYVYCTRPCRHQEQEQELVLEQ